MIKERALELVAALRSGKYKQAHKRLKVGDSYCCLGVACDISKLSRWNPHLRDSEEFWYDNSYTKLPDTVREYFGFETNSAYLKAPIRLEPTETRDWLIEASCLIDLNDRGATFEEIATIIEQHWEEL